MGLLAGVLLAFVLGGCGPKRVVRTDPAEGNQELAEKSGQKPQDDKPRDNSPKVSESGLPDPEYRGRAGATTTPAPEPLTGSRLGFAAASLAKQQLGKPYQWGAEGPDKFDCSGLVLYVYKELGVQLPRASGMQAYSGAHVDFKDLQPGDLVFFKLNGSSIDHVGIYVGHSKFVHAPKKYQPVKTESLNNSYWRRHFKGGRRLG